MSIHYYWFVGTCRLYIELQTAIKKEDVDEHAMSKRWDDWVTNIWDTLGYDRHDSLDSSMTVPLDPGVTFYPHENQWGLQMDSLETDLHNLVQRKNLVQPPHLEELTDHESILSENVQNAQPLIQEEITDEQIGKQLEIMNLIN